MRTRAAPATEQNQPSFFVNIYNTFIICDHTGSKVQCDGSLPRFPGTFLLRLKGENAKRNGKRAGLEIQLLQIIPVAEFECR
jgi:hypothetical protein